MKAARRGAAQAATGRYLESFGFSGARTHRRARRLGLSPTTIATAGTKRGVGVSHNPESNMKLASGTAPVPEYLAAGVALGLGTDGAASNNDLDMFEAMRQAAFLHKLRHARSARGRRRARRWKWPRSAGRARSAWTSRLGSLEAGKLRRPDRRPDGPARQTPMYDPVSHLVYTTRGDDVETTIVNGKVLMRGRQGADARRSGRARPRRAQARRCTRSAPARAWVSPNGLSAARRCTAGVRYCSS